MKVILSIKPEYVEKIVTGEKQYEFRKIIFRNKQIRTVYIYVTAPTKKIIGSFTIGELIEDHPKKLWTKLWNVSGMNKQDFFTYFTNKEKGFAIEIKELHLFDIPIDPHEVISDFHPPQSFSYLRQTI
jgi:predicted transcriptional regulator